MPSAEESIAARLLSYAPVAALVGDRVYPDDGNDFAPTALPALVYTVTSETPLDTLAAGGSTQSTVGVEVRCCAETKPAAKQLADAVKAALDRWRGGQVKQSRWTGTTPVEAEGGYVYSAGFETRVVNGAAVPTASGLPALEVRPQGLYLAGVKVAPYDAPPPVPPVPAGVTSVAGRSGAVTLGAADVADSTAAGRSVLTGTAFSVVGGVATIAGTISLGAATLYTGGSWNWVTPYGGTSVWTSLQPGQAMSFYLQTAEGKLAGMVHYDVASPVGRLLRVTSQPGVPISLAPSENELLRLDGFGGSFLSFFGVPVVGRQTLPGASAVTAADIRGALIALGLCQ